MRVRGWGLWMNRWNNGTTTMDRKFVWSGSEIVREQRTQGASSHEFYFFQQGVVVDGTKYFYTRDQLGSIREVTSSTAIVVVRYDYGPWGKPSHVTGSAVFQFNFAG